MTFGNKVVLASIVLATATIAVLVDISKPARSLDPSAELVLYCAAGVKPPVEQIVKMYKEEYSVDVRIQYGGSGTLLSNLSIAKRGDLYIAGDDSYIETAREKGLVAEAIPLATMRPVIAVRRGNPMEVEGINDLSRADLFVGMANPDVAAVGRIAREVLSELGLWDEVANNVKVYKPTVMEVANDIKIGAIHVGIVWDSTVAQYSELEVVSAPALESVTRYVTVGVLTVTQRSAGALRFARYLSARDRGVPVFESMGYGSVVGDEWSETPEIVLFSGGVNRLAIEDTIREFEVREGVRVTTVYNGCGILVAQIKAGQRPDVYFACDRSFMTGVSDLFIDQVDVAETDIVIVTAKGNPRGIRNLADLTTDDLKLGVANPEQSALGSLTVNLLKAVGVYEGVMSNVRTRTPTADLLINQIRTGALDAVIVYRANTSQVRDHLDIVDIVHRDAKAIQPIGIGRSAGNRRLAERLVSTIRSSKSRTRFEKAGFRWRGEK